MGNWENEFKKWLPTCNVVKLIATQDVRDDYLKLITRGQFDVCLTSYEGVKICEKQLKKIHWIYVIIDEAHKIKNELSKISQVVRHMKT